MAEHIRVISEINETIMDLLNDVTSTTSEELGALFDMYNQSIEVNAGDFYDDLIERLEQNNVAFISHDHLMLAVLNGVKERIELEIRELKSNIGIKDE